MKKKIKNIVKILSKKGIQFAKGLTDLEIIEIETKFNILFPPDLKLFLQTAQPTSDGFVNWRLGLKSDKEFNKIIQRLNWPWEGMVFDIKSNSFWMKSWGEKTNDIESKIQIAKEYYETYPRLIPIYSHRYIPELPKDTGNPIFSVHQMDIIYYGSDLETYFANEFGYTKTGQYELDGYPSKKIEFWSLIAEDEGIYN